MAKPLVEIIGKEKAEEVLASVDGNLKPHLEYLIGSLEVELGTSPPSLWLNDERVYVWNPGDLNVYVRTLLWESGFAFERKLSRDDVRKLAYHLTSILNPLIKPREEDVFRLGDETIRVVASDGVSVPAASVYYAVGDKLLIGEITYANVVVQKERKGEIVEYNSIEPFIAYAIYEDGALIDQDIKPLKMLREEPIVLNGKPINLSMKTVAKTSIETLPDYFALKSWVQGLREPKPLRELFEKVRESIARFIVFDWDHRLYDLLSCYIIATYFYDLFNEFPFLYFHGPYGSGKSRGLFTVVYLSRKGIVVTDPSEASLYRTTDAYRGTLGVDESILGSRAWKIIRAAFQKGTKVPRVEKTGKETFVLSMFEPYAPYVFAATELPSELGGRDVDESRAIFVVMRKARDPAGRHPKPEDFRDIREELYLARLAYAHKVLKTYEELGKGELKINNITLYGREKQIWNPILTIAKLVGEEVYREIAELAAEHYAARSLELYVEERLIVEAISKIFLVKMREARTEVDKDFTITFQAKDVYEMLREILVNEREEMSDKEFERKWKVQKIGKKLNKLGIFKKKSYDRLRVVSLRELFDIAERYGFEIPEELRNLVKQSSNQLENSARHVGHVGGRSEGYPSQKNHENLNSQSNEAEGEPANTEGTPLPSVGMSHSSHMSQKKTEPVKQTSNQTLEEAIVKVLETEAARDGLSDVEIYRVLAELQRQGKLKAIVNYESVKNVLNKLKAEGKVKCEENLWKLH